MGFEEIKSQQAVAQITRETNEWLHETLSFPDGVFPSNDEYSAIHSTLSSARLACEQHGSMLVLNQDNLARLNMVRVRFDQMTSFISSRELAGQLKLGVERINYDLNTDLLNIVHDWREEYRERPDRQRAALARRIYEAKELLALADASPVLEKEVMDARAILDKKVTGWLESLDEAVGSAISKTQDGNRTSDEAFVERIGCSDIILNQLTSCGYKDVLVQKDESDTALRASFYYFDAQQGSSAAIVFWLHPLVHRASERESVETLEACLSLLDLGNIPQDVEFALDELQELNSSVEINCYRGSKNLLHDFSQGSFVRRGRLYNFGYLVSQKAGHDIASLDNRLIRFFSTDALLDSRQFTPAVEVIESLMSDDEESEPITDVDTMSGVEFERFCMRVLEANGYSDIEDTKATGDQGLDILATRDGVRFGIQCKCYSSHIGNKAVQEALAGKTYYGCHVVAVLTNSYFTSSAIELADKSNVVLWDRDALFSMIRNVSNC